MATFRGAGACVWAPFPPPPLESLLPARRVLELPAAGAGDGAGAGAGAAVGGGRGGAGALTSAVGGSRTSGCPPPRRRCDLPLSAPASPAAAAGAAAGAGGGTAAVTGGGGGRDETDEACRRAPVAASPAGAPLPPLLCDTTDMSRGRVCVPTPPAPSPLPPTPPPDSVTGDSAVGRRAARPAGGGEGGGNGGEGDTAERARSRQSGAGEVLPLPARLPAGPPPPLPAVGVDDRTGSRDGGRGGGVGATGGNGTWAMRRHDEGAPPAGWRGLREGATGSQPARGRPATRDTDQRAFAGLRY
jgi:hypothetical protein